jgi:hypothetical protein
LPAVGGAGDEFVRCHIHDQLEMFERDLAHQGRAFIGDFHDIDGDVTIENGDMHGAKITYIINPSGISCPSPGNRVREPKRSNHRHRQCEVLAPVSTKASVN